MSKSLRVLMVEDAIDDAILLLRELRRGGYDVALERVETAELMAAALDRQPWDIVIADYTLPHFSAPAALDLLQSRGIDLPFIIISGTVSEDMAVAALKAGAHDFIDKNKLARLLPAVERELREAKERRARRAAEMALHERERRFRSLIENTSDIIAILDLDGVITYAAPSLTHVLGYAPEEWIGNPLTAFAHPYDGPRIATFLEQLQASPNDPKAVECRLRHYDEGWRFFEAIANNLLDEPGVQGIVLTARDITSRKHAEAQIKRQIDRLNALRTIDLAITASLDLRVTLNVVLDQITAHLGVDAADILILDLPTQLLTYTAGRGFRGTGAATGWSQLGRGFAGHVALERRLLHITNLNDSVDFRRSPLLAGEDFITYFGVPLIAKGQVRGVLELFHRAPLDPDAEWLDFLEALAGQAAIAIDNALLFSDLQRSNIDLALAYDTTLEGWSRALDLRDHETEGHTQRVTDMTIQLARAMGIRDEELVHIRRGALLHDIGKMGIPDHVLLKPGPLTEEEWGVMRRHPVYAYELLSPITFLQPAIDIPYCHHEKWDGTGYPRGLAGEAIPLAARIFAVVDVWDALRSDRPYRKAWPEDRVLEYIRSLSGTHFDERAVEAFLKLGAWI